MARRSFCRHLGALLVKNAKIKARMPWTTLAEIALPVLIMLVMVGLREAISNKSYVADMHLADTFYFNETESIDWWATYPNRKGVAGLGGEKIVFLPDTLATPMANAFAARYPLLASSVWMWPSTADALSDYMKSKEYGTGGVNPYIAAAIEITQFDTTTQRFAYSLWLNGTGTNPDYPSTPDPTETKVDTVKWTYSGTALTSLVDRGELFLQNFVESYFIQQAQVALGQSTAFPVRSVAAVPAWTPAYRTDDFADSIGDFLGLLFTIVFLWPVTRMIKLIVEEKELRIKEGMRMMGLSNVALWLSWFITYIVIFLFTAILIVIVTSSSLFEHSDKGYIFIFFWLFQISTFSFALLLSAFFSNSRTASTFGAMLFLGSFFAYYAVSGKTTETGQKVAGCLSAPLCFGLIVSNIVRREGAGTGVTSSNASDRIDNFAVSAGLGMLVLDTFFYLFMALYFEKVIKSEWGTQLPWYFPVSPAWWRSVLFPEVPSASSMDAFANASSQLISQGVMEPVVFSAAEAEQHKLGVRIVKMRKEFGDPAAPFVAVNDLCLDMYTGQIMALLGHNGAGKTTTINMLTGMIPVSRGNAEIFGQSIVSHMPEIRQVLGVCPQHDILFPTLTVKEHLELYAAIKGVPRADVARAVDEMIHQVGLVEKVNTYSAALSGGMKRKLSVAIALLGDSKIVFLDEPTSGMDPYSRRATWDLLKKAKSDRVIILTTHFMDEADQLGDRIAIMANGRVQCCGSSLFLKSKYGVGYTMTIVKDAHFKADVVRNAVLDAVPDAELLSNIAAEVSYRLPLGASSHFADMFDQLDANQAAWGIDSYGISVTTLEEVFLRVGHEADKALPNAAPHDDGSGQSKSLTVHVSERPPSGSSATSPSDSAARDANGNVQEYAPVDIIGEVSYDRDNIAMRHFHALLIKRLQNAKRNVKGWVWTAIIPFVVMLAFMGIIEALKQSTPAPLRLDGSDFNQPLPLPFASFGNGTLATTSNAFATTFPGLSVTPLPVNVQGGPNATFDMASYLSTSWQTRELSAYGALLYSASLSSINGGLIDSVSVFVNTTATFALPTYYTMYNQAILRNITAAPSAEIASTMRAFPLTANQDTLRSSLTSVIVGIGFAFVPASFIHYAVQEWEVKSKHQQMISGVSPILYWGANYAWDLVNYVVPAALCIVVMAIFDVTELFGSNFGAFFLSLVLYGLSVIPFTYLVSFLFDSPTSAQNVSLIFFILVGAFLVVVGILLDVISSTKDAAPKIKMIFRLLPTYSFVESISNLILRSSSTIYGSARGTWDIEVVGYPFIFMAWQIPVFSAFVLAIEYVQATPKLFTMFNKATNAPVRQFDDDDADVVKERERLTTGACASGPIKDEMITIRGLRKVYPGRLAQGPKVAVHNLHLGIPTGECLGFLGINGAGKTTTMKMLTNDIYPTSGEAYLAGMDIMTEQQAIRHKIGYCPQFDALIGTLTAREHLMLFGRIKGVSEEMLPMYVESLIEKLGLQEGIADRPCAGYSGGNKRKLCVGIALIGNPPIVFLDEPSTGMDPGSRRFMWDLISQTMRNRSVILTTHSMEECEALCQRIAIMVGGRMKCLGTAQHLKSTHGNGYQLDVNVPPGDDQVAFRQHLESEFGDDVKLLEGHQQALKYRLPRVSRSGARITIGSLFRVMEAIKQKYSIREYSVSETTLEQIFIHFARQQEEETGPVAGLS